MQYLIEFTLYLNIYTLPKHFTEWKMCADGFCLQNIKYL